MNLILLRGGWPPIAVRPEDRAAYLAALERASGGDREPYDALLLARLDATLGDYIALFAEAA